MLQDRQAFALGLNMYVPAMALGTSVINLGPGRFTHGIPATAGPLATLITAGVGGTLTTIQYLSTPLKLDSRYGRTITVTPSGVPGNANVLDVIGADYLGQPMYERFTGSAAASTALVGLKAFGWVLGTRLITLATNTITVAIGSGLSLGLPWKGQITTAKEGTTIMTFAQINTASVAAVLTDPQTATTGDPRGLYTPVTPPNGVLNYETSHIGDPTVNAAGNGGLLGIRHLAY
jgi:hypothetical protein